MTSGKARRAIPSWHDGLAQRAGISLVAVAAAATTSAFVFGGEQASVALDGPVTTPTARDLTQTSRSAARPLQLKSLSTSELAETVKGLTAVTPLYTTARLNVRAKASEKADLVGSLDPFTQVLATGDIKGKYRKVTSGDLDGWVLASELTGSEPLLAAGTSMEPCARGSRVENRLRPDTILIYRSVCPLFPAVNSYGGWRAGGLPFHKNGRALDIMLTPKKESALGHEIANYLIKHAKEFNIDHIIFEQRIWTPSTPRWRHMADRGSLNANHFNHVHVAVRASLPAR